MSNLVEFITERITSLEANLQRLEVEQATLLEENARLQDHLKQARSEAATWKRRFYDVTAAIDRALGDAKQAADEAPTPSAGFMPSDTAPAAEPTDETSLPSSLTGPERVSSVTSHEEASAAATHPTPEDSEVAERPGADKPPAAPVESVEVTRAVEDQPDSATSRADMTVEDRPDDAAEGSSHVERSNLPSIAAVAAQESGASRPARPAASASIAHEVVASPFGRFSALRAFQEVLRGIEGVRDVRLRHFDKGTLEVRVEYEGGVPLAEHLAALPDFPGTVLTDADGRLLLRLEPTDETI